MRFEILRPGFVLLCATLLLSGCQRGRDGVVRVEVSAESGVATSHVCLTVVGEGGLEQQTDPLELPEGESLVVAIYPAEGMRESVTVTAQGFAEPSCAGSPVSTAAARSARFEGFEITPLAMVLGPVPNCDGSCGDPACEGTPCDDGSACTQNDVCRAGVCTGEAIHCAARGECFTDACEPAQGCVANFGASCTAVPGGVCLADGTCANAEVQCANGLDDDGDDLPDCEDPDCEALTCRTARASCDVAEVCSAGVCPADQLAAADTECRAASGTCDAAEVCDGTSELCPSDLFQPGTTVCRGAAGACDLEETCSGDSPTCPADTLRATSDVCRPATGLCDVAESCTGASAACPADGFQPSTVECRPASGRCDVADRCSGNSAACAGDAIALSGSICRPAVDACDVDETCDGLSTSCPADGFASLGAGCTNGTCNGAGACMMATPFPFTPSNTGGADLTLEAIGNSTRTVNCTVDFDTSPGAANRAWCNGEPVPAIVEVNQPGGPQLVVIPLLSLTTTAQGVLRFSGTRPVALLVYGDVLHEGVIRADATGATDGVGGASSVPFCTGAAGTGGTPTPQAGKDVSGGGGGGGGGGFGAVGGAGGLGSNRDATTAGAQGSAGSASGTAGLVPLLAGCRGAAGGAGDAPTGALGTGGPGGGAGGAVQLSVSGTLTVAGKLSANGGGGQGSTGYNGGGGGGGSGGALLLEANSLNVVLGAQVGTTGGGGGEGAGEYDGNPNKAGQHGQDGLFPSGGAGGDLGANKKGGPGGLGGSLMGSTGVAEAGSAGDVTAFAGGGGGGGSRGRIRLRGHSSCMGNDLSTVSGNLSLVCPTP